MKRDYSSECPRDYWGRVFCLYKLLSKDYVNPINSYWKNKDYDKAIALCAEFIEVIEKYKEFLKKWYYIQLPYRKMIIYYERKKNIEKVKENLLKWVDLCKKIEYFDDASINGTYAKWWDNKTQKHLGASLKELLCI